MSYEEVDDVIVAWAKQHGLTLSTEFGDRPCRFCYVSGGRDECFQISIEPPDDRTITVNAWDIETRDDAEFHRAWHVPVAELHSSLEKAIEQVGRWARRRLPL